MKRDWNESRALSYLSKNTSVDVRGKVISGKLNGLTACSAVDYLKNYHKYILIL